MYANDRPVANGSNKSSAASGTATATHAAAATPQPHLRAGEHVEELVHRAEAARERDERVRQFRHHGFSRMHRLNDVQVCQPAVCDLAVCKRSREDPDDFSPTGEHGISQDSHQTYARAAVDDPNAATGELAGERHRRGAVDTVRSGTRAAEHTNPSQ